MSRILDRDFFLEVARGNVTGMKGYSIPGRKDGVGITVLEDITETGNTVMPRPAGTSLEVASAHASDDISGVGVQEVSIHYLDANGYEQDVAAKTNGSGVTAVGTDMHDIQWIHSSDVGATGVAVGDITLQSVGGGTVYEQISAGGNQSLTSRFKVPNGKIGYILGWQASAVGRKIDFRLRADVHRADRELLNLVFNFQDTTVLDQVASGWIPFRIPLKCPELSTIKISGLSFTGTGDGGVSFDILLIDNSEDVS